MTKEEKICMVIRELERVFGRLHLSVKSVSKRVSEAELDFYIKHLFGGGGAMNMETFRDRDIARLSEIVDDFCIDRIIIDVQYDLTSYGWRADVFYIDIG